MQSPDGTYLASEFNYSLPRKPKGYDTVGYNYHSHDRNTQLDPRFMTSIRPDTQNDKGYYSDRTYERPICDQAPVAGRDTIGYHRVNSVAKGTEDEIGYTASLNINNYLNMNTSSETPTLPLGDKHS